MLLENMKKSVLKSNDSVKHRKVFLLQRKLEKGIVK